MLPTSQATLLNVSQTYDGIAGLFAGGLSGEDIGKMVVDPTAGIPLDSTDVSDPDAMEAMEVQLQGMRNRSQQLDVMVLIKNIVATENADNEFHNAVLPDVVKMVHSGHDQAKSEAAEV